MINCATGPVINMIDMSGRTKLSFANAVATLLLNFTINPILIPAYGIAVGAAAFAAALA
jgi:O-antigen/teichoic acid export membrane protein